LNFKTVSKKSLNHFFENENLSLSCMGREAQKLLGEEWSRDGKLRLKKKSALAFFFGMSG